MVCPSTRITKYCHKPEPIRDEPLCFPGMTLYQPSRHIPIEEHNRDRVVEGSGMKTEGWKIFQPFVSHYHNDSNSFQSIYCCNKNRFMGDLSKLIIKGTRELPSPNVGETFHFYLSSARGSFFIP